MAEGQSAPETEAQKTPTSRLLHAVRSRIVRITGQAPIPASYEPTIHERFDNDERQHAFEIEKQKGKVPEGYTRLYRGVNQQVGPVSRDRHGRDKGSFFSNIIFKAHSSTGPSDNKTGQLFAVDVPREKLKDYAHPNGFNSKTGEYNEFVLPAEVAEQATSVWFRPEGGYSRYGMKPELASKRTQ